MLLICVWLRIQPVSDSVSLNPVTSGRVFHLSEHPYMLMCWTVNCRCVDWWCIVVYFNCTAGNHQQASGWI